MLGPPGIGRVPKVITIRVNRGEGLQYIPKSDHKQKKYAPKWKVVFKGGKHKLSSDSILAPNGCPIWNYEVTLKLASKSDPVVIRVTDADDHHVGQVVIPLVTMLPRPANPSERPTDQSRMLVADLEPTKKASNPLGRIFYWIWVEEYLSIESDGKSTRGSVLSLNSTKRKPHLSIGRHRESKTGSMADSLNYSGSVLSVGSSHMEGGDKKKPWYKRKPHKLGSKPALRPSHPASSMSMSNVYETVNRPSVIYNRPAPSSQNGMAASFEDHDGSILGANSDLTSSDIYNLGPNQRSPSTSSTHMGSHRGRQPSIISTNSMQSSVKPLSQAEISSMRNELLGTASVPTIKQPLDPYQSAPKPRLLSFSPKSCLTTGGVQVTVECSGVTEGMTRHGAVLVDGHNVPRQDWYFKESAVGGQSELCIHMPERPAGQCWIELETMNYGRLRCPQQFSYMPAPQKLFADQRSAGGEEDSYSSSPADSDDSDTEEMPNIARDTISTILPNPNALGGGNAARNVGMKAMPNVSTVTDSGFGSPPPSSSLDPGAAELNGRAQMNLNGAQTPRSNHGNSHNNNNTALYDPFQSAVPQGKTSARGAGSNLGGSATNPLDESFKMENEGLRGMLKEANDTVSLVKKQNAELEQKLAVQVVEVDRLSRELCNLKNRLLQDGMTDYLRK